MSSGSSSSRRSGHLVTASLMLRVTSSPDTRGAASSQPMIILVPVPPSPPVKRQPTPQPKVQAQTSRTRAAPSSAGPGRARTAANTRNNNRPQTAHAILTRPPVKGPSAAIILGNSTQLQPLYVKLHSQETEIILCEF